MFLQSTRILHNIDELLHQYSNTHYIRKKYTDRIMDNNYSSENILSVIYIMLVIFSIIYSPMNLCMEKEHQIKKITNIIMSVNLSKIMIY